MTTKRMIFSLNTGRCGSVYLHQMLSTLPDVTSLHEPPPAFHDNWDKSFDERCEWLKEVKIPYILGLSASTYIEMSPQFARGFVEPMLLLEFVPDVIVIRRDLSEVALSLWRSNNIPGRSDIGKRYSYSPDHIDVFLRHPDYRDWMDYMVCYWTVLEMDYRIDKYSQVIKEAGGQVVETNIKTMTTKQGFMELLEELNLPEPEMRIYNKIWMMRYNQTLPQSIFKLPAGDMRGQEKRVREIFKDILNNDLGG